MNSYNLPLPTNHCQNLKVLVCVGGSIAAYKSLELVRVLVFFGAQVRVVLSASASQFIGALSFQALSGHPVLVCGQGGEDGNGMQHITLARWADVIVCAPCTANRLARFATASGGDWIDEIVLAAQVPIVLAPAMNQAMWQHKGVGENVTKVLSFGYHIVGPVNGTQACGESGIGNMIGIEVLVLHILRAVQKPLLNGHNVLVTAGGTRDYLDPVRWVGNASSGQFGLAFATYAWLLGAEVHAVLANVEFPLFVGIHHKVQTTAEYAACVYDLFSASTVCIAAAAVVDYAPMRQEEKIKKKEETMQLQLHKNPDVLAWCGHKKETGQFLLGFALETHNDIELAKGKMQNKKADALYLNTINTAQNPIGGSKTNGVLLCADAQISMQGDKVEVAQLIWQQIIKYLPPQNFGR